MKAIIIMTFSMELVLIAGLMEGNIAGIGWILNLKGKVYLPGKMGENMLGSIKIIRNMDMEFSNGLTELAIVVIGLMESSMERGFIKKREAKIKDQGYGLEVS